MSATATKERSIGNIQFVSVRGTETGSSSPSYKRFHFHEDPNHPLKILSKLREEVGLDLRLSRFWTRNMIDGVGIDPQSEALALTLAGIVKGSIGELAQKGMFIVEIGVLNNRLIPDVAEITLGLKVGKKPATSLIAYLPNLEDAPGALDGDIKEEIVAGIKKSVVVMSSVKPFVPNIPGYLKDWTQENSGEHIFLMASPENSAVILSHLKGSLSVRYR